MAANVLNSFYALFRRWSLLVMRVNDAGLEDRICVPGQRVMYLDLTDLTDRICIHCTRVRLPTSCSAQSAGKGRGGSTKATARCCRSSPLVLAPILTPLG